MYVISAERPQLTVRKGWGRFSVALIIRVHDRQWWTCIASMQYWKMMPKWRKIKCCASGPFLYQVWLNPATLWDREFLGETRSWHRCAGSIGARWHDLLVSGPTRYRNKKATHKISQPRCICFLFQVCSPTSRLWPLSPHPRPHPPTTWQQWGCCRSCCWFSEWCHASQVVLVSPW